jgi:hypothetical protein
MPPALLSALFAAIPELKPIGLSALTRLTCCVLIILVLIVFSFIIRTQIIFDNSKHLLDSE